jgi:hypothetical protein
VHEREQRLRRFEITARSIGQEIERRGLSEEEVLAKLEETQQQSYDDQYGSSQR